MDPSNGSTEGDGMSTALCDLLVKLPIWDDLADRKDFVKSAFRGKHPALAGLIWENAECAVAGNLARQIERYANTLVNGRHPAYALLSEIREREYDANPEVQALVARLRQSLPPGAPRPPPPAPTPACSRMTAAATPATASGRGTSSAARTRPRPSSRPCATWPRASCW